MKWLLFWPFRQFALMRINFKDSLDYKPQTVASNFFFFVCIQFNVFHDETKITWNFSSFYEHLLFNTEMPYFITRNSFELVKNDENCMKQRMSKLLRCITKEISFDIIYFSF